MRNAAHASLKARGRGACGTQTVIRSESDRQAMHGDHFNQRNLSCFKRKPLIPNLNCSESSDVRTFGEMFRTFVSI